PCRAHTIEGVPKWKRLRLERLSTLSKSHNPCGKLVPEADNRDKFIRAKIIDIKTAGCSTRKSGMKQKQRKSLTSVMYLIFTVLF
ncbi:hypothetical protein J7I93_18775, partial [Bacillus sp. ISL-47]|uniref:hypothetical protein n=1 Tax=Bacillus sp. ISL-47 TaxID=2819130 RepID=UPI001BE9443D